MKTYTTSDIRNIVLLGNAGSGKTTLAESMLLEGGVIKRRGDTGSKNTVSDHREIEHSQEGSVFSTLLYAEWKGKKVNILDAPGADDFVGGAISSLHIADTAILLLNTQNGIEVGAEIHWRHAQRMKKPVVLLANHLDHDKTNFEKTVDEAKQFFGNKIALVQYPINGGPEFDTIIDLRLMKMLKWGKDGGKAEVMDIPANELDKAEELQAELIETAAENDEELMEIFFENETLTPEEMQRGILAGIRTRNMFPVLCSVAKKNFGVQTLLDFICNALPAPDEMETPQTTEGVDVVCSVDGPASAFVFKNSIEQHIGEVLHFKVMSGKLTESIDLINTNRQSKERVSQLFAVAGKNREKVSELCAGDLGATVKLKETRTNHTLSDKAADYQFAPIPFPEPKHRTAIKAANEADEEKLGEALNKIREEDPTVVMQYLKELKQLILSGQGEFHLNTVKWHLDNVYGIETEFIKPKIQYRETITKAAQSSYRHKKQSGGAGQFGEVHMIIEPFSEDKPEPSSFRFGAKEQTVSVRGKDEHQLDWGGKLVFYNCIVGGVIDARFLPAIMKGIMEKMETGPLTGSYARDIRVMVYDGKMHPVDSNEISFKLAGMNAFKTAFKEAGPKIMEPIYDVEVLVPTDRMGDVMSDLQGRRAMIQGMNNEGRYERISVRAPLAEMDRYSTALSSLTNGRAMYSMKFAEYVQVPSDVQEVLLKAYEAEQEEE